MEEFALPSSLLKKAPAKGGSEKSTMLSYVNLLEGYKTKFKNLHWSAKDDPLHKRVDEFLAELSSFQDSISEDIQGTIGPFATNEIKGTDVSANDALTAIQTLFKETVSFRSKVEGGEDYFGLVSEIDNFCHNIKKYIYLFKMC